MDTLSPDKRNELEIRVTNEKPDIICITETLPKNKYFSLTLEHLQLEHYDMLHSDIEGRGVCMYIARHIKYVELDISDKYRDGICASISLKDNKNLVLSTLYRSPSNNQEQNIALINALHKISSFKHNYLSICGDFNLKEISWAENAVQGGEGSIAKKMFDTVNDLFLMEMCKQPTRFRVNITPSCLDWVLTSDEEIIDNLRIESPFGRSDHATIHFDIVCPIQVNTQEAKYNYYKGNYDEFRKDLQDLELVDKLESLSTQQGWDLVQHKMEGLIERHIPKKKYLNKKSVPWFNRDVRLAVMEKRKAWGKYRRNKSLDNWENFTRKRKVVSNVVDGSKNQYEEKIAIDSKHNPKGFWSYVKKKVKSHTTIKEIENEAGEVVSESKEKADILNNYFSSVFTKENLGSVPGIPRHSNAQNIDNINITAEDIMKRLLKLDINKSAGPDNIHSKILREVAEPFSPVLESIYRKSLDEGILPHQWKKANVVPLHKKGSRKTPGNYRPVSLTAICCKILERIIRDGLVEYLKKLGLIDINQHGFTSGKSCNTQLLEVLEQWTEILDAGGDWDCIYMDYQKAFDSVPHERLLKKVESLGISGKLYGWIKDFLHNRKQRVALGNIFSEWSEVSSGIPQGSVLGPVLFIIFINDLPQNVTSTVKLFADDTKLYRKINRQEDADILQVDINSLIHWSQKWQLPFNIGKCSVIHYGKNNLKMKYKLGDREMSISQEEKDLGVTFANDFNFKKHIRNICAKANGRVGLIKRTFSNLTREMFIPLYKSLIRPVLEYCSTVWAPMYRNQTNEIEKIQRRATKLVKNMHNLSYGDRLRNLGLETLEYRRLRADVIQVYRIFQGIDKVNIEDFFQLDNSNRTRGHSFKLVKPRARGSIRLNSFSHRVVSPWNNLKDSTVTSTSVNAFKSALGREWVDHPKRYEI